MTPRLMLLPLAFALVATVTFASPAGEDDAAATATEKEMVLDPSTGEMVTAPEYGGTIRPVVNFKVEGIDPYYRYTAGVWIGLVNQKLGFADWAIDRDVYDYKTTYLPDRAVVGGLAESWENPDPLTYVFKLRDDVFWHDKAPVNGRQLTAHDFEAVNLQTTNPDLELHPLAYRAETAFTFNTRIEPWSDIRVRQALSMAIDYEFFDLGYYQIAMDYLRNTTRRRSPLPRSSNSRSGAGRRTCAWPRSTRIDWVNTGPASGRAPIVPPSGGLPAADPCTLSTAGSWGARGPSWHARDGGGSAG